MRSAGKPNERILGGEIDLSPYPKDPTREQGNIADEDEGSAPKEGDGRHLEEVQKPTTH